MVKRGSPAAGQLYMPYSYTLPRAELWPYGHLLSCSYNIDIYISARKESNALQLIHFIV